MTKNSSKYTPHDERCIIFHPQIKRVVKSTNAAILLQQINFWSIVSLDAGDDGWFYKTFKKWKEETAMSKFEIETARNILLKNKFIEYETRGANNRCWYRLNRDAFLAALEKDVAKKTEKYTKIQDLTKKEQTTSFTKESADMLKDFSDKVNPNCATMYSHKAQRDAAEWLLKNYDKETLDFIIENLHIVNSLPYVKSSEQAFSPHQLRQNISSIMSRMKSESLKRKNTEREIA